MKNPYDIFSNDLLANAGAADSIQPVTNDFARPASLF
jgi:hypothetical protein